MNLSEKDKMRFWAKVDIKDTDECWNWTAGSICRKYGKFQLGKSNYLAHRISYFLATEEDPGDLLVCHKCDNPACCNPAHLWLGTHTDNMRDMRKKQAAKKPKTEASGLRPKTRVMPQFNQKEEGRFWAKVDKREDDKCWEWKGSIRNKYGAFKGNDRDVYYAHRVAYFLATKEDPGSLAVCHICDNPVCCNPNHLWLGTHVENMRDMKEKKRIPQGERHFKTKLTIWQVRRIRALYATGNYSQHKLARDFGLTHSYVGQIVHNKTRKEKTVSDFQNFVDQLKPGQIYKALGYDMVVIIDVLRSAYTPNVAIYVRFVRNIGNARQYDILEVNPEKHLGILDWQPSTAEELAAAIWRRESTVAGELESLMKFVESKS